MRFTLYILAVLFVFSGCKKYPEDNTLVHLRKPEKRLKIGTDWKITEYKVNGVDSIPYINSTNIWGIKLEDLKFEYDNGVFLVFSSNCDIFFTLQSNNREVLLGFTPEYPITYPLFFSGKNIWQIKRMDHEFFTIEIEKNAKIYRVTFEYKK